MATFTIRKGKNISLKGKAAEKIIDLLQPKEVAIQPPDIKGLKPRLEVKEGHDVQVGSPILSDKDNPEILITSPVSGRVKAINRGEKRALLSIVIENDERNSPKDFSGLLGKSVDQFSKEEILKALLETGLFASLRQRPFHKICNPADTPKAIFIRAMSTDPLAPDNEFIYQNLNLNGELQVGIDVLNKLTDKVYLSAARGDRYIDCKNVEVHTFKGPHPAGNIGTHIHHIDPVQKGEVVWFVDVQDLVRIGKLFAQQTLSYERVIVRVGSGVEDACYVRTLIGAPIKDIVGAAKNDALRYITGSVLSGRNVGYEGFLGFYHLQITAMPEGGDRQFLGWLWPGFSKYSFTRTFVSAALPEKEVDLDADKNGGDRAIVLNNLYDRYNALDIMTYFLIKAVVIGDIEESEKLGILECDQEDFALCTFACPSKTEVGSIIQGGLDLIEKEG